MIIYKRFLIFFNIHLLTFCFIEKSKYIKDITSSKHLEIELNKNVKLSGMMLVYSSRCHHCKEFSKTYIKLAETYNNQLFFYSMSETTDYSKKFTDVYGYPTIYFYKNGNFSKNQGSRSFESLSKIIDENYLVKCHEISYIEINNIYNNKYLKEDLIRNLIIGFIKSYEYINIYNSITSNFLNSYIDLCYYCSNYEKIINYTDNNNTNENKILSFNKIKGNYTFNLDEKNPYIKNDYIHFIYNNVINPYEDINTKDKLFLLDRNKNKLSLLFVYNSKEQKENYKEIANKLYKMNSRKEKGILNYFLINKNVKYDKLNEMKENTIYLIDIKLKRIIRLNNLDYIEEIIKINNMRLTKDVENEINNIFYNNKNLYLNDYSIFKFIFGIFFIVLLFVYLFYKFFFKYIKISQYSNYKELVEKSNINTKIELT